MTQLENNRIFRYGLLYGSRMPWMHSREQIFNKIALANKTHPPPRDVANELFGEVDEVGDAWEQYNIICVWRLDSRFDMISKSDKMLNYGRLFDDA